jgi:hypothetical protein
VNIALAGMRFVNRCSWASNVMKQVQTAVHLHGAAQMVRSAVHNYAEGDWVGLAVNVTDASMNAFAGLKSCFTRRMPFRTPEGEKLLGDICEGDEVLTRAEGDPDAPVVVGRVVQVLTRTGRVWVFVVRGVVIESSAEHPVFVRERGWVEVSQLCIGDWVQSNDGTWNPVEEVRDTGRYETLYNVTVEGYHTYFVGSRAWGFSVWAHNYGKDPVIKGEVGEALSELEAEAAGETIKGKQVTLELPSGRRARPDTLTETDQGNLKAREAKFGPTAKLTEGQLELQKVINAGGTVIPRGDNAEQAGLTPGVPVRIQQFEEDRF